MSRFFVTGRILTQNLTPSPKYIVHPPVPAWLFCFSHLQIWVLGSNPPDSHERCRDNNDPLLMSITWQKCSRQVGNHWSQHHTCSQLTFHPLKTSVTAGLFVRYCKELEGDSRVGRILDVVAALELVPTLKDTNLWMLQQRKIPKFQSNIWRSTISKSGNRYLSAVSLVIRGWQSVQYWMAMDCTKWHTWVDTVKAYSRSCIYCFWRWCCTIWWLQRNVSVLCRKISRRKLNRYCIANWKTCLSTFCATDWQILQTLVGRFSWTGLQHNPAHQARDAKGSLPGGSIPVQLFVEKREGIPSELRLVLYKGCNGHQRCPKHSFFLIQQTPSITFLGRIFLLTLPYWLSWHPTIWHR